MLKRILSLIIKEFLVTWKDTKSRMLIIVPPLVQLIIFANAATMEVKNISTIILDKDKTFESQELIAEFEGSQWFSRNEYAQNEKEIQRAINEQKAQIGIIINNDFSQKLKTQKKATIQIIVDGRQTNTASIINGYASKIINQYERKKFSSRYKNIPNINQETRHWFNPNLSYQWYTLASLLAILSAISALILTALSISREQELGTLEQLRVTPLSIDEILLGKMLPPLIIATTVTLIITTISVTIFNFPFQGSVITFLITLVFYLLSIINIGLFISSICKTQQQSILGAFSFLMPAILISGYVSPISDMPEILQRINLINPIHHYLKIAKGITLKGIGFTEIEYNIILLICIAIFTYGFARLIFQKKHT